MQDSSGYQLILEEGEIKGLQETLLIQGKVRFGPPDQRTETALKSVTDLDRLERMAIALLSAPGWEELLATP
jgi:hypothetical protein